MCWLLFARALFFCHPWPILPWLIENLLFGLSILWWHESKDPRWHCALPRDTLGTTRLFWDTRACKLRWSTHRYSCDEASSLDMPLLSNYQMLAIVSPNSNPNGHSLRGQALGEIVSPPLTDHTPSSSLAIKSIKADHDRIFVWFSALTVQSVRREDLSSRLAWDSTVSCARNIQVRFPRKLATGGSRFVGRHTIVWINARIQVSEKRLRSMCIY